MSDFGDHEPDDTFDTADADPEQVARRLFSFEGGRWDHLTQDERVAKIAVMIRLIAWLKRSGHFR